MDQATFNFITIAGAVVQLIILIVFLLMARNVAKIAKGRTQNEAYWLDQFEKHLLFGNNEQAIRAAREGIWLRYKSKVLEANEREREFNLRGIKEVWQPKLDKLDESWPEVFE